LKFNTPTAEKSTISSR